MCECAALFLSSSACWLPCGRVCVPPRYCPCGQPSMARGRGILHPGSCSVWVLQLPPAVPSCSTSQKLALAVSVLMAELGVEHTHKCLSFWLSISE